MKTFNDALEAVNKENEEESWKPRKQKFIGINVIPDGQYGFYREFCIEDSRYPRTSGMTIEKAKKLAGKNGSVIVIEKTEQRVK